MYSRHRQDKYPSDSRLVRFATGQPLGFFLASILVVPSLSCMVLRVAFSPGGMLPLPFQLWLGFPEGILVSYSLSYGNG